MSESIVEERKIHGMYAPLKGNSLRQGDIIDREKLLPAMLGHQDYIAGREDFVGFCVITQTCDLKREACVEFIHLSVIRNLVTVFSAADTQPQNSDKMRRLLRDVLGQEYNKRGFFYLHSEPSVGIGETWVVDLRTMFSLHHQHYPAIVSARKVSMNDLAANKLGWMAGQLFSRVPTPDWGTTSEVEKEKIEKEKIEKLLKVIVDAPKRPPIEVARSWRG